ncbi:response regulator [Mesonia sp. K7]|uniref:response regulator n=1 Tax=Mesonia sp. K7 TaxID=2218606 RepID=UPI000DA89142|nr:response regulator [Mesonia sp. K7]PZD77781.1 response regulator [Mesonia sp. K7]
MVTICIIDDDKIYQTLLKKTILRVDDKVSVSSFYNGLEAFEYFKAYNFNYEIILIDINMPIMDGWELIEACEGMCERHENPPKIYIATSSIYEEDRQKARTYAFVKGYITKPITTKKIEEILH